MRVTRTLSTAEMAQSRIDDPSWDWEANPTKAIADATSKAAEHSVYGRHIDAAYWTAVSIALSAAAGTDPGIVARSMAEQYGISLDGPVETIE